jgi:UDP-2,3-diacylglucosamine hydrolase
MTRPSGDLVVVADVHLGRDDPDLDAFVAFLRARADDTAVLVLLGDVFSLWLGREKFTEAHHHAVLDACVDLRARGVRVVFIEGNREYAVGGWEGRAFDSVAESLAEEPWAGRRWYLAHGDLLNREDRVNAAFRAIVRSSVVLGVFGMLPASVGMRAAAWLERTLRHRNLRHKTSLPDERLAAYATWFAARGFDAGVIGHVHVERRVDLPVDNGTPRSLWVLPDWRTARRYLRVPRVGEPRFEAWGPPRPDPPAVIDVDESDERVRVVLARRAEASVGELAAISSGHGPEVRRGRVTACEPGASPCLTLALEPGPPVQVGDRVILRHEEGP